jgi:hypothetical protein
MAKNPELYVGCGLTHAPKEFVYQVDALKERLREDWEVLEFFGLGEGTPEDIYQKDIIENVGGCDAFVGICDEVSQGLTWELREAAMLRKPTLAVAHKDTLVSRVITGAPAFNPTMSFRRYENMVEDVPAIVLEEFAVVRNSIIRP